MIRRHRHTIGDTPCLHLVGHGLLDSTTGILHVQHKGHTLDQSIEDLFECRYRFSGKPLVEPSAGIQASHLLEAQLPNSTCSIGRPVDGPVVHRHNVSIGRAANIQLNR